MEQLTHRQVMRILSALMSGLFLAAVESTIVATAAPTIVDDLGGLDQLTWVFTAYMLATTVSAALWGKLSDLFGRRQTFLSAITLFVIGSLLAGAAQNMLQLILFRALQGFGGGGLTALGFIIMADILAPRQRGRYVGFISATYAAGSVVGPMVGGLLVDWFHWRLIFLINLPLGLIAAAIASPALRGVGGRRKARLDLGGAATLSGLIVCLLLAGVWGGNQHAWTSPTIVGLVVGAMAFAAAFVFVERRAVEPVLALRLLRSRVLVLTIVVAALTTVPFNAAAIYLPLFLQTVHGASVSSSGLQLAPLMLSMSAASIVSGRMLSTSGRYRRPLLAAVVSGIVTSVWLSTIDVSTRASTIVMMMILLGISFGMGAPVLNVVAQNAMPVADLGAASSALITFRSLGMTLGIGAVGSVLLGRLRSGIAGLPGGTDLDPGTIASGPATISVLGEPLRSKVVATMADSVATAMAIGIPLMILALLVVWFLPETPLRNETVIEIHQPERESK